MTDDRYQPSEDYMRALFARPARPPKTEPVVTVAGDAFCGISGEEADALRWAALRGEPR